MNLFRSKTTKTTSLFLIQFVLVCLAFPPSTHAVVPPPDGGYPGRNTAEGTEALNSIGLIFPARQPPGTNNTAIGFQTLFSNTTSSLNTAVGSQALFSHTNGEGNTAVGAFALQFDTGGSQNSAFGRSALQQNTTGIVNTAVGYAALGENTTGSANTAVGFGALGSSGGDNNIALGVTAGNAVVTASNVICIGEVGEDVSNRCYIGSIFGVPAPDGAAVFIKPNGQLGTVPSSARFKQEIKPMNKASEVLLALKPVTFRYKRDIDAKGTAQFGLVAEEVEKVNPDLVVRDKAGKPYSVRYDAVNAMLLNEFLKEHKKVEEQQATIADLKSMVAKQQEGMEALTAHLKEQAAQIQKVSAELEATKVVPQMVLNNR